MKKNDRSLSIVHINTHDNAGGAAKVAWRLAEAQRNAGHNSRMVVGIKSSNTEHSSAFPIECDPARQSYCKENGQLFYDCQGSHKLIANPIVKSANILHLHNLHGGYFNPFSISALSHLKPFVWTLHDMQAITGHCAHSFDCQRWQTGCGRCPYLNIEPSIQLDTSAQLLRDKKLIYDHSRLWLVTPSQWLKSKVEKSILQNHPVELIYNSINTTVFRPYDKAEARRKFGIPAKAMVIGAVAHGGALTNQWKGGKYTQEALDALKNKLPDYVFVNMGGDYKTDDPRIINIPHIDNESELARAYSTLDIFLNTSIADNCPLVILEALSCGIPIVSFTTGGIPELVRNGMDGYVTEYKNIPQIVKAVERLATNPQLRAEFGSNSRERATSKFDIQTISKQHEDLYLQVLEESKTRKKEIKLFPMTKIPNVVMTKTFEEAENCKADILRLESQFTQRHGSSQTEYDVSIVLCTKDRASLLDQMLASLKDAIKEGNCEVIVIKGNSSDNTQEVLHKHGITKTFDEVECLGPGGHSWPQLYNFGFSKARGKWAMYASDDIVFSQECIIKAINSLNKQKDEVAGGLFFYKNTHPNPGWDTFGIDFTYGPKLLMNYGLVRLDYFRQVGGLDEAYRFYCADGDLCFKLYESGKQFIPLPGCFIVHNNIFDKQKTTNIDNCKSDIELYAQRWRHFVSTEIPRPQRLLWQEDFVEVFDLPLDLKKIDHGIEYFWHGLACFQQGLFEKAKLKFLQTINSSSGEHWLVLWYVAKAAYECGDKQLAEKAAGAVTKLAPNFIEAKELLQQLERKPKKQMKPKVGSSKGNHVKTIDYNSDILRQLKEFGLWNEGKPLRLHLGCGQNHFDGYINIDYQPSEHIVQVSHVADIFGDITKLDFPQQSVDEVRLHHVFEHFSRVLALAMLIKWHKWLKIGGKIHIETPDLIGSAKTLISNASWKTKMNVVRHLAGDQSASWGYHVDHWFAERFEHTLERLGFESVQTWSTSWTKEPYLSNVEVVAAKNKDNSLQEQLKAAEQLLWNSTVAPEEKPTWEAWRKQLHTVLKGDTIPLPSNTQTPNIFSISQAPALLSTKECQLPLDEIHDFNQRSRDRWIMGKSKINIGSGYLYDAILPENFNDFTYSKKSHFDVFKEYDVELYKKPIDPNLCDLKVYQDLLVFSFIKENIPKGSRILDIGGGKSRILNYFKNNYECWNLDKLEGLGNGPIAIDSEGYRLVKDYIGCFNKELSDNYFDFVFSISTLEHVPEDDEGYFKNIRDDIDRILKPGGYSLHCFDVVIKQDSVWTNKLLPFLFKNLETAHSFIPLKELNKDSDLYCMSKQVYSKHWEHTTKQPYEEFGKPLSYNILWRKALKFTPILGKNKQEDKHSLPKISVITPSYNQAEFLEECIDSILSQNYPNLEYIIMDGASTDGSAEIIRKYEKYLTYWQSKPDTGQYAAINEGLQMATGQIMTWLNSDDKHHTDSLYKAAYIFEKYPDLEWMTGRPTAWNDKGELILVFDYLPLWSREKYLQRFFKKICIQQESTFWKRSLWEKAGPRLRTDLQFAGDLELWVRFFRHTQLFTVDTLLGGYRYQPNQKTNLYLDKYMQEGDRIIDREIADIKRNELTRMLPAPRPISFDRKEFQGYKKNFPFKVNDAHLVGAGNEPEAALDVQALLRRTAQDIRCRGDFKIGENTPLTIATSIAPKELEKQIKAIKSWIRIGFDVVSINCREEIGILQESFPDVKFVQARRDARKTLGKPFVYLDDFLKYFQESNSEFCSIVNSDIRLVGDEGIISFIKEQAKDSIVYGSRIDVDSSEALNGRAYNKGFDFFFFHKSLISSLPKSDFCIGAPWWDYLVPLVPILKGIPVKKLVSPFAYHIKHPYTYSPKQWLSLGEKFFEYLYKKVYDNIDSRSVRNYHLFWQTLFSNYPRPHLADETKVIEDEGEQAGKLCTNRANYILEFLSTKSLPISYLNGSRKACILNQKAEDLSIKDDFDCTPNIAAKDPEDGEISRASTKLDDKKEKGFSIGSKEISYPTFEQIQQRLDKLEYCQKFVLDKNEMVRPIPGGQTDVKLKQMGECFPASFHGKRFLEVGANKGFFSMLAAKRGASEAIALEPMNEYVKLMEDIKRYFKLENFKPVGESFDESIKKYGLFDIVFVGSVYHYIFLGLRDHAKFFSILSDITSDYVIFEGPTSLDDADLRRHCEENGQLEFMTKNFTPDAIFSAAKNYFGEIEYISKWMPARDIYVLKKKKRAYRTIELLHKKTTSGHISETFLALGEDGKQVCLKKSGTLQCFNAIPRFFGTGIKSHPLLVELRDCWITDGIVYQVMEYLEGYEVLGNRFWQLERITKAVLISRILRMELELLRHDLLFCDLSPANFMAKGDKFKIIDLEGLVYTNEKSENAESITTFGALTLTELILRSFFDSKLTRNTLMELFGLDTAFSYVVKESSLKKGLNILCDNYSGIQPFISDIEKIFLDWKYLHQPQLYRSLLDNIKSLIKPAGMVESRTDLAVRNHDREYLVSAIISTYNSEKFLRGCLNDLEQQTIADKLEIIVVNSNSEENEEAIVHKYQQKYNNIVYIKTEEREGIYTAWNRAIKIARGKFITNANTDDRHRSDAFEILSSNLEKHPDISLVYADCYVSSIPNETYNENSKRHIYRYPDFLAVAAILHDQFGPQPLWRKKIHETIGYFDGSYKAAGDHDFNIRFSLHFKALHIAESLGLYLEHPGAISFRDDTLSQEQGRIAFTYSNAAIIEALYKQVGIACDSPEEKSRIHLDMGIRAMEYYPPWKTGKPECSLEFALKCFQRAVKLKPDWAAAHNNFAVVLGLGGNFQDATKLLEQLSRRIQEPTINYNFKLIYEVSRSRSAWSGAKLITSGLSLPSQRDLSLKQKWSEPPVESLIPLQPKGSSKSGNLKILFYFDRIGNFNETSPAGTVIAVLNFARVFHSYNPDIKIYLTGDLVCYAEHYESFQVIPLPPHEQRKQFITDYDVVFFATHVGYFKGLIKPSEQIWVLWQHCWEADDKVTLSHSSDFDIVICLSELHKAFLRERCFGDEKLITIPNFIDINIYSPKDGSRSNHSIMFAGGINPHKCIHILLDAFRLVRQQVKDTELHIYGDGQMWRGGDTYGNQLKSTKPAGVYFHGYVDNKDMPNIYSKHSLLCLPSILESFGLVTVEAQACGCIPIVNNVGGVAATLVDGQTGLLYSPNTPEKLAETIIKAIKLLDTNPSIRQKAVNFTHKTFGINKATEYISKLLDKITVAKKVNAIKTLFEANDIEQAESDCKKLLQKNPNHPDIQLMHAMIMLRQGNEQKANSIIVKLLENFPKHLRALNDLGLIAMKAGDIKKALRYFTKAYKFNPWDKKTTINCYTILKISGLYKDAKILLSNYSANVGEDAQIIQLFREAGNLITNTASGTNVVSQEVLNNRKDVHCQKSTSMPLVSIIMPAFNSADYIGQAIESILAQDYRNFELIITDDGSTDNTKEVIQQYNDGRIRYLFQENNGVSSARNLAIKKAKGQYIMPLDADDMMTPDFITSHLAEFEKHPDVDLVYSDVLLIDENSTPIRIMNKPEYQDRRYLIRDLFRVGHPIVPFRLGIRRSVFEKIGFYDEDLLIGEDYDMMRRFVKARLKPHHLSKPLHLRRMRTDSLSGNFSAQKVKCHFEVIRRFTDTFTYDELFPDVAWDKIASGMRQLHAKCLTAGTYLALGQEYIKSNALEYSRTAFDRACSELNDCIKMDPKNQGVQQLLQKSKRIRARYTKAAQQAVTI